MTRYGMVIDLTRCIGCNACSVACKKGNNIPEGVFWNRVETIGGESPDCAGGTFGASYLSFQPISCQHCSSPSCVAVCPTGASYIDPDTNLVLVDYEECIGCKSCIEACPYDVRHYNDGEPSFAVDIAFGDQGVQEHRANTVEKCTFCYQRITKGETPNCMLLCPARARFFGDLDDPESDVSKMVAEGTCEQLLPEEGTNPNVYYIV